MNTQQELIDLGLNSETAARWLDLNQRHLGELHGINKITNITFIGVGKGSDIELTCTACGNIRHKNFSTKRNKWAELAKTCPCQKHILTEKERNVRRTYNSDPSFLGKVYGTQKVVDILSFPKKNDTGHVIKWVCECTNCGERRTLTPANVKNKRCKCLCEDDGDIENCIGKTFGRLTVLSTYKPQGKKRRFVCRCSCGNTHDAEAYDVKSGKVKSCGCISREISENAYTKSPLYPTWKSMLERCENNSIKAWENYGGRGISVCEEWHVFRKFEEWCIENGYRPGCGLSLDRIDVNGNYEPSNCRFANIFVQNVNRRPQKPRKGSVTINGVTKTKKAWCEEYGVWQATVDYRIKHMGMSFEEALIAEKQREGNHNPLIHTKQYKDKTNPDNLNKINSYIECNLYMAFCRLTDKHRLIPQVMVEKYRLDFLVEDTMIAVECDGYDQHKTKEQMANDYKRERYLISQGYTVIRFTGSEINGDCDGCAKELLDLIDTICEEEKCHVPQQTEKILRSS